VSTNVLHKNTNSLTYNELAIESTRRLVLSIIKEECKGLEDFFEVTNEPQGKELRSTNQERLPVLLKEEQGTKVAILSDSLFSNSVVIFE
jgi:hypothetical protein